MFQVVITIIAVMVGVYYYKRSPMSDPSEVKDRYRGRNDDQKEVIRYFCVDGCLSNTMSDSEYDKFVKSVISKQDFKKKALNQIDIDEFELKEIDPINFENWVFGKDNGVSFYKRGEDGVRRSSAYQISWLFFSSTQVYLYQNTIHFDKDDKGSITEEYFYRDITNFSTSSDTIETPYWDPNKRRFFLENVDSTRFALTVPGDKLYCSLQKSDYTERAIKAMKAKLREKKMQ